MIYKKKARFWKVDFKMLWFSLVYNFLGFVPGVGVSVGSSRITVTLFVYSSHPTSSF